MKKKDYPIKILVSINDNHKRGHSYDLKFSLKNTKLSNQISIYQDLPKKPDTHLQLALEEILLSKVILLDATFEREDYKDKLIKFGIAFALEKQRFFFYIKENSARVSKIQSEYLDSYTIEALGYYDLINILDEHEENIINQTQTKPQKPTEEIYEAFSVVGVNEVTSPDLTKTIKEFAAQKGWHAAFHKPPSSTNKHEELSRQVGSRTFTLFCINEATDPSVYIAIGLALGFGIPFLIIAEKEETNSQILSGYTGVINYASNTELIANLLKYTQIFLSPEIFKSWEGFTYFYLLSKIEKRLNNSDKAIEIEEIEYLAIELSNVGRAPLDQAYILLGDIYRRKNQLFDPLNTDFLKKSISWYKKALKIHSENKRCLDGIESTKKLIQLIDLIKNKSYESIPELIYLIGNGINSEQYQYLRFFLIDLVKKLLDNKEYLPAIALLASMQKHDESGDLNKLWESVNPKNFLESIQKYQEKELKLKSELKDSLEKIEKIDSQLSNAYKEVEQASQVTMKLENTTKFYGEHIFVNLGRGWASYMPLKGKPYIRRGNEKILAKEGMATIAGDTVYDGDDQQCFHWLSNEEKAILDSYNNLT